MKIKGFRKDNPDDQIPESGQYGKGSDGNWFGCVPGNGDKFNLFHCNLSKHEVVEHADGTITVSPSILVTSHRGQWHGYLRAGEWEEC